MRTSPPIDLWHCRAGIAFCPEMLRALVAGQKTQTRRRMNPQPNEICGQDGSSWEWHPKKATFDAALQLWMPSWRWARGRAVHETGAATLCMQGPYLPGDRLYVKEGLANRGGYVAYQQDGVFPVRNDGEKLPWLWKADRLGAMYCPREFARHAIAIERVRVEQLHDLTEEDAIAEGCAGWHAPATCAGGEISGPDGQTPVEEFIALWRKINGPSSFDPMLWVWVLDFRRLPA